MFEFNVFENKFNINISSPISFLRAVGAVILFLLPQLLLAQKSQSDQLQFRQLTIDDGLPSMYIYDILQDEETYLWIGTEAGLSRFDGYNFRTFTTRDGLPNNEVINVQSTADGRIWANMIGSISTIMGDSIHTNSYSLKDSGIGYEILELSDGKILIATQAMLYKENGPTELELKFKGIKGSNRFTMTKLDQKDEVWIYDLSYLHCYKNEAIVETIKIPFSNRTLNYHTLGSFEHYLVFNSLKGLVLFDLEKRKFHYLDPEATLLSKIYFIDNYLWGVSADIGLIRYELDATREKVLDKYVSFTKLQPTDFLKDKEGNFWVSTMGNGLYFSPLGIDNAEVYTTEKEFFNSKLSSIFLEDNKIWIGTRVNSLIEINEEQVKLHEIREFSGRRFNRVRNIHKMPNEHLLLTTDIGLLKWDPSETIRLEASPMKSTYVNANKKVLTSTPYGVYETNLDNLDTLSFTNKFLKNLEERGFKPIFDTRSYEVMYDSKENIWFSNVKYGLVQLKKDKNNNIIDTIYWQNRSKIFNTLISEIVELDDGTICLASSGQGIIFIQDNDFYQITTDDGISSDICNDMVTDGQQIWVATNLGLTHLDKVVVSNGQVLTNVSIFDKSNGLISNELETLEERDGKLYLVSPSGLMVVKEENLRQSEFPPRLVLKSVKVNGIDKELSPNPSFVLAHDENNLQIGFIGISYKSFGNIRYKYRLEGLEDHWTIKKSSEINYTNLDPGDYKFVVYSLGRNGKQSKIPVEVKFKIEQYFWYRPMSLAILSLLGIALIFAGLRYFTFRRDRIVLSKMVEEKTSQLNEKMQVLEETNKKLKQSNKELEEFAHVVSHDLKTPLRSIGSFVQVLDRKLGDRLDQNEQNYMAFISNGVKKMEMVIKDLLSMSKLRKDALEKDWINLGVLLEELESEMLASTPNDQAKLSINDNPPSVYFNKTNAKQLFQNLIGNGFKYNKSEVPSVDVGWNKDNGQWTFYVKDNGIGIEEEYQQKIFEMFSRLHSDQEYDGTGIGLAICKKIVEANGGSIWVTSSEGNGATFHFTLGDKVRSNGSLN